ncbi:MAG: hypothetical protein GY704_07095, partial [Phycisphaeraceae bacterium]|nr:hypothetical protein [Phycisphaeraceae bacterium]
EMGDSSLAAGLDPLLAGRHIEVDDGFVVELGEANRNLEKSFEIPVVAGFGHHEVCEDWHRRSDLVCLPLARSFGYAGEGTVPPLPLAMSSEQSFGEMGGMRAAVGFDHENDIPGPLIMAVLSPGDEGAGGPLLVIGDSNFATNEHIDREGNANFALDAVAWLIRDGRRVAPTLR